MSSETPPASQTLPPKPAATVLIVRDREIDAGADLEVLMVRRSSRLAFGASAWVFPGGAVSPADFDPAWADIAGTAFTGDERAVRIAAVRESFEEAGVLVGWRRTDGAAVEADRAAAFQSLRREVEAEPARLLQLMREEGLRLDLGRLAPFAHWITPSFEPKRYDTRFFLAVAPSSDIAEADGRETTDHGWLRPRDALERHARGEVKLMLPTRLNLEMLGASASAADAEAAARARTPVTVEPVVRQRDGVSVLCIPAEAGYSICEETLDRIG